MSKWTPGPWAHKPSIHGSKYRYVQIGADEGYTTLELEPADARLIAAAPDLLEALKLALPALEAAAGHTAGINRVRTARAAIAKAESA